MCTLMASETQAELDKLPEEQEESFRLDAEVWRAGGGFLRNEVNITRSGAFSFPLPTALDPSADPLECAEEAGSLMAFAADWIELDSSVEGIRFDSELALRQEIAYASYLSIATIILPPPRLEYGEYLADYARAINGALASSWHINVRLSSSPNSLLSIDALAPIDLDSYACCRVHCC